MSCWHYYDCGNEHDDANHNRMSKFECVNNYCQQRVEYKILEDCFTKSISIYQVHWNVLIITSRLPFVTKLLQMRNIYVLVN